MTVLLPPPKNNIIIPVFRRKVLGEDRCPEEIIQERNLSFRKAKRHSLFMLILTLKPMLTIIITL